MKKTVLVTYTYHVEYEHEQHLKEIKRDLEKNPIFELHGAGIVEGKAYHYSCNKVGKGVVK